MIDKVARTARGRRRRTVAVAGVLTAGAAALLAPTLFQAANAAELREFTADVRVGVQIYQCDAAGAFAFKAPRAELQRGIHHDAGPVWQARDGSAIKGAVTGKVDRPGTIPELTLSATSIGAPRGMFAGIDTIRRINTGGGLAPSRPCTAGEVVEVPYTATYVFSGPKRDDRPGAGPLRGPFG